MNNSENVVFDRAAGYYDQTRSLPPHEASQLADALWEALGAARLRPRRDFGVSAQSNARSSRTPKSATALHVLEIGVGTGRVAGPLAQRGLSMFGIDLAGPMLSVLRQKFPALPVALADMTRLPFAPAAFDGVVAFHVFHLVSGWRDALAEAVRVLRPGGKFIYSIHGRDPNSVNSQLRTQWRRLLADQGVTAEPPGTRDDNQIDNVLRQLGCRDHQQLEVIRSREPVTARSVLDAMEKRIWSDTWLVPDDVFAQTLGVLRAWASERFDLDEVDQDEYHVGFHVYTV